MCLDADDYCPYEGITVNLKEQFDELAQEWNDAAMFHSFYRPIMCPEPCRQLVKLGEPIIPLIIQKMEEGDHWVAWSWLLSEITGINPDYAEAVVHEDGFAKGNVQKMAEWWISWYKRN